MLSDQCKKYQTKTFRAEVEALIELQHPNIIKIIAFQGNARFENHKEGTSKIVDIVVLEFAEFGCLYYYLFKTG